MQKFSFSFLFFFWCFQFFFSFPTLTTLFSFDQNEPVSDVSKRMENYFIGWSHYVDDEVN